MSRSYRHTPKRAYDGSDSEKEYKIIWHQKMRAVMRQCMYRVRMNDADSFVLPHEREVFSDWDFGKSRRCWFDPKEEPRWMRK